MTSSWSMTPAAWSAPRASGGPSGPSGTIGWPCSTADSRSGRPRGVLSPREQVLDARSRGRFYGAEAEPRQGLRAGHIPGSFNLPYDMLYRPAGTLLPPEGLKEAFREAGLDSRKPVATTCGSGVTASVLALGLHLIGHRKVAVYDGSWTEWGGRSDTPVEL